MQCIGQNVATDGRCNYAGNIFVKIYKDKYTVSR